jgi:hypothetical protein
MKRRVVVMVEAPAAGTAKLNWQRRPAHVGGQIQAP